MIRPRRTPAQCPTAQGRIRAILCLPTWVDYLAAALDDMCQAALDSPMTLARAAQLLQTVLHQAPPERREPVTKRLNWITQQLRERHPDFMHGTTA